MTPQRSATPYDVRSLVNRRAVAGKARGFVSRTVGAARTCHSTSSVWAHHVSFPTPAREFRRPPRLTEQHRDTIASSRAMAAHQGVVSFGYFTLDEQRKVASCRAAPDDSLNRNTIASSRAMAARQGVFFRAFLLGAQKKGTSSRAAPGNRASCGRS